MKTRNRKSKLIALIAMMTVATVAVVVRVRAQDTVPPTPDKRVPLFGILGITRGQTARLNVANVSSPDNPLYPPDPCRVTISFVDGDGNVLVNNAGLPVRRTLTLEAGHAAFLQINGDNFVPRDQTRFAFRPVVLVSPPDPNFPPDPCIPTLEIINNITGHTSLISNGTKFSPAPTSPTGQ